MFGRVCFPSTQFLLDKMEGLSSQLNIDDLEEWFSDIKISWPIILASAGFALVIGYKSFIKKENSFFFCKKKHRFIFLYLMKYCAGIMTWIAIIVWIASFILLGIFLGQRASAQKELFLFYL